MIRWKLAVAIALACPPACKARDASSLRAEEVDCGGATYAVKLPALPSTNGGAVNHMTRDSIVFTITGFTAAAAGGLATDTNGLIVPCAAVPVELRPSLETIAAAPTYAAAFKAMRVALASVDADGRALHLKAQTLRHPRAPAGETAEALEARFPFKTWEKQVVENSRVKGLTRVLYRSPRDAFPAMTVAQTLTGIYPQGDGPVRETEVIQAREDESGNFDFYAYDENGRFALRSEFQNAGGSTVVGPVPYTCMACHYDKTGRVFQRLPLTFVPSH